MIEKIRQWFVLKFNYKASLTEKIRISVTFTSEEESLETISKLSKYIAEMNSLDSNFAIERFPAGYRVFINLVIKKSKHSECTSYLSNVSSWIYGAKTLCKYEYVVSL